MVRAKDVGLDFWFWKSIVSIIIASALTIPFILLLVHLMPANDYFQVLDKYIPTMENYYDKTAARVAYFGYIGLLPFALLAKRRWLVSVAERLYFTRAGLVVFGIIIIATAFLSSITAYVQLMPLVAALMVAVVLVKYIQLQIFFQRKEFSLLALLVIIFGVWLAVFSYKAKYLFYDGHWNVFTYAIWQVYDGKTLFVDWFCQYGSYPYFYLPFLKTFGISVLNINIISAVAGIIALLAMYYIVLRTTKDRLISFLTITAVVLSVRYMFFVPNTSPIKQPEIYLQYFPLRVLWPALLLPGVMFWYQSHKRIVWSIAINIFCSLGILWNADSGIVCIITWMIVAALFNRYQATSACGKLLEALKLFFAAAITACAIIGLFVLYTYIRSQHLPNFSALFIYQEVFFRYGFSALPTPAIGLWWMLILLYAFGLYFAINNILLVDEINSADIACPMVLVLSLIGFGIFPYYLNRSCDSNLLNVLWPAILMFGIFVGRLYRHIDIAVKLPVKSARFVLLVVLFAFLLYPTVAVLFNANTLLDNYRNDEAVATFAGKTIDAQTALASSAVFILKTSLPTDKVLIFSQSPIYYHYTRRTPLVEQASIAETLSVKNVKRLLAAIENKEFDKIYIERLFLYHKTLSYGMWFENLLMKNYNFIGMDKETGLMLLYSKK